MKVPFFALVLSLTLLFTSVSGVLAHENDSLVTSTIPLALHLKCSKRDKTFNVFQNQKVIVTLKDQSASTGLVWDCDRSNVDFLELEDISVLPASSTAIGAPTKRIWTFKVIGTPALQGDLTFFQRKSWNYDKVPSSDVTFHLNLVSPSDSNNNRILSRRTSRQ